MHSIRWLLVLCVLPHPLLAAYEGVLVAGRDSQYHAFSYLLTGITFLIYETGVRIMAGGVTGVWIGFATFQWIRLIIFSNRVSKVKSSIKV